MRCMTATLLLLIWIPACRPQVPDSKSSASSTKASSSASVSKYDSGPRAGEAPVDESRVAIGERLFQEKGCSACHAFGRRLSGPDLAGVTMRRTAKWMENQILHPEVMTKEDPISRQLMATHALQMPNQGLTPDQAKSVIEYLKHENREASVATQHASASGNAKGDGQ